MTQLSENRLGCACKQAAQRFWEIIQPSVYSYIAFKLRECYCFVKSRLLGSPGVQSKPIGWDLAAKGM